MEVRKVPIGKVKPAAYNPRRDLKPGDPDFDALTKSVERWGMVEPLVWNERTGNLVGGHQRLKVLKAAGAREVEVSVVDLDDADEKALNIALNRIRGGWDDAALTELLADLEGKIDLGLTGFTADEVDSFLGSVEGEAPKGPSRPKVEFDGFRVFHARLGSHPAVAPNLDYLLSWGLAGPDDMARVRSQARTFFTDSGFLQGVTKQGLPYLKRQREYVQAVEQVAPDWVAMMDVPVVPFIAEKLGMSMERLLNLHLRQCEDFAKIQVTARRVWAVQGYTDDLYARCIAEMAPMVEDGDVVAIGGLKERSSDLAHIRALCQMVHEAMPASDIHLFGVLTPEVLAGCYPYGVRSGDAATAALNVSWARLLTAPGDRPEIGEVLGFGSVTMQESLAVGLFALNAYTLERRIWQALQEVGVAPPPPDEAAEAEAVAVGEALGDSDV